MGLSLLTEEKIKKTGIETLVDSFRKNLCLLATSLYVMGDETKIQKAMMLLNRGERVCLSKHMNALRAGLISEEDMSYFDVYINRIL